MLSLKSSLSSQSSKLNLCSVQWLEKSTINWKTYRKFISSPQREAKALRTQCYNTGVSWSKLGSDGVSRSCSQITQMKGKWWCMCFILQCLVHVAFAQQEQGWSCRQTMLLAGISSNLRQYRAIKRMGCYLPFLKDHINIITIMLLLPGNMLKGRLSNFSTVWMLFYLLNIILLLYEIYLFQSFPLAFIRGSSISKYSYWGSESHDHLTYA